MTNVKDDIGMTDDGTPVAIGQEARDHTNRILDHPDATPILMVAELHGDLAIRTYGPPSLDTADLLDHLARQYRHMVQLALKPPS